MPGAQKLAQTDDLHYLSGTPIFKQAIMFSRFFRRIRPFERAPAVSFTDRRIAGIWLLFFGK